jgi:hypothetical protein
VNSGSVAINFGSTPGTNFVSVDVTGQTAITGTSKVKAYKAVQATATHNEYEHIVVPLDISVGNIVAGTGFTIYVVTDWRLDGTFNLNWEWVYSNRRRESRNISGILHTSSSMTKQNL